MRRRPFLPALFLPAAAALVVAGCFKPDSGSGPLDIGKPDFNLQLFGKILDGDNRPLHNAVARLKRLGLIDTTGSDGVYEFLANLDPSLLGITAGLPDTLELSRDGQVLRTTVISDFIDTLPELFIVQRDIYGSLLSLPGTAIRIRASLSGDGIPANRPREADLWHNQASNGFSGFLYFIHQPEVKQYSVVIGVFDPASRRVGQSDTVHFSSVAGDIKVPDFHPFNAVPVAHAGADTTVSIKDTLRLSGRGEDLGDAIAKWEWSMDGKPFAESPDGKAVLVAPDSPRGLAGPDPDILCILRVSDPDGNTALDTVRVAVALDAPVPAARAGGHAGAPGDTVKLLGGASDRFGRVVKWEWSTDRGRTYADVSPDSMGRLVFTKEMFPSVTAILRITDDDGNIAHDSVRVYQAIRDSFAVADSALWRTGPGAWSWASGKYRYDHCGASKADGGNEPCNSWQGGFLVRESPVARRFTYSADVTRLYGKEGEGLVFLFRDSSNFQAIGLSAGNSLYYYRIQGGAFETLWKGVVPLLYFREKETYRLSVSVTADSLAFFVGDKKAFATALPGNTEAGRIGLGSRFNQAAEFDNLELLIDE